MVQSLTNLDGLDRKVWTEVDAPSYVDALIGFQNHMTLNRVTGIYHPELLVTLLQHDRAHENINEAQDPSILVMKKGKVTALCIRRLYWLLF